MDLIKFTKRSFSFLYKDNDFFVDKLFHRHTTLLLGFFVSISTFKRLYMSPINCWIPAELRRYEKFINKYCWVKGTRYVEQHYDSRVFSFNAKNENLLLYYQWVHLFLLVQAFLFYLPKLVWVYLSQKVLDYDLYNLVDAARIYFNFSYKRETISQYLCANLNPCNLNKKKDNLLCKNIKEILKKNENAFEKGKLNTDIYLSYYSLEKSKFSRSTLLIAYIMVKVLYLFLAIIQLFLMNYFLSNRSNFFYAREILDKVLSGESELNETDSRVFPRVAVCDVNIRENGARNSYHEYNFNCVLSLNIFNEKILMILYFWILFFLIPICILDLLKWIKRFTLKQSYFNYKFVKKHLKIYRKFYGRNERCLLNLFSRYYIEPNSIFILRLFESNSNSLVISELLNEMWKTFVGKIK